ncbi:MAG TPA: Asp-tRNA(Asn)/Glu-tRNA(Gln) amidotransferase subunit GatC [Methanoregulaceae archaeon]|nr:Asp-tRNA(Asn)/Glu-tRNA(Gln) amidotransferase subunit GatC [Methanoregulaceae archaeon]HQJ87029.1 Asp-tRNA(Asn)/Glu-tRNA(Gln) amidotransferase subunit GatC [Methanoregulaceae archaeon]
MVNESDVRRIAELADVGIPAEVLPTFTAQFNRILEYFDILDTLGDECTAKRPLHTVLREDVVSPSLPQEAVLANAAEDEDGFVKAPRVM